MAVVELDPLFIKAHRLLHSKAKDSGTQKINYCNTTSAQSLFYSKLNHMVIKNKLL
jgi:hypothetical protein